MNLQRSSLLNPKMICDLRTIDAGKACTDASECETICVVPREARVTAGQRNVVGSCDSFYETIGRCQPYQLEKGVVVVYPCAD